MTVRLSILVRTVLKTNWTMNGKQASLQYKHRQHISITTTATTTNLYVFRSLHLTRYNVKFNCFRCRVCIFFLCYPFLFFFFKYWNWFVSNNVTYTRSFESLDLKRLTANTAHIAVPLQRFAIRMLGIS